jgi:hypothetical protein
MTIWCYRGGVGPTTGWAMAALAIALCPGLCLAHCTAWPTWPAATSRPSSLLSEYVFTFSLARSHLFRIFFLIFSLFILFKHVINDQQLVIDVWRVVAYCVAFLLHSVYVLCVILLFVMFFVHHFYLHLLASFFRPLFP